MKKRKLKFLSGFMAFMIAAVTILGVYIPAEASTNYQHNIVARANYLYNSTWVCKKTVAGWRGQYYFYAGNTYRIPYGQPVHSGRYVGYYVTVDDFLASTKNAKSAFYTSRSSCSGLQSVYYATDCSAFVSWCWGIPRQTTATIPKYSTYIGMANASNVNKLKRGDCLNSNSVGHVVLVTGLTYNKNGALTQIEITEQTPPQLKRSYYTPQQLAKKYGAYYGIYRYKGAVPPAPSGNSSTNTNVNTNTNNGQTTNNVITTMYYPKCAQRYTSFYPAMNSIGISCDWSLHCRIAAKNGIEDFKGTAKQNTQLLNLLKKGELLNPDYVDSSKYYAKCNSSYTTFYAAMDSIGVSCDWELHCKIAQANGIKNFTGTAAQNTKLLQLLKTGKLIKPDVKKENNCYPACASSYTTFYAAMESIGISCDWELHCQIAKTNGIKDFTGTAAQNTELLKLLKAGKLINPEGETTVKNNKESSDDSNAGTSKTKLEKIVVGVNERYIGDGYEKLISSAFSEYLAKTEYEFDIEYRTLGDSDTTVAQLGSIINSSKDIDFVLAAGANITTQGGVKVVAKAKLSDKYNTDGKRYGALLNESKATVMFYNFVTGENYHYCEDATCDKCGEKQGSYKGLEFKNGVNVNFIKGSDTSASNKPVINSKNSIVFTADNDGKDEVWEINLGDKRLEPNKRYTVQLSLKNSVGNVGVGCVRDEYISGIHGVNTFYGNYADKKLAATKGYKLRVRRGFYEISDIVNGTRKTFPYSKAYVDADGYVKIKMDVAYNGTTYVSKMYYLNKASEWVKFDEAYVGISSSNTFGLYVLHGSTSKSVAAIKDVKYSIEDRKTSYSKDVATPKIKLIDYNVQTGNTYYSKTASWLKSQSPDIIGLQEVGPNWYKSLKSSLGGTYGYVGTPRSGTSSTNSGNEASPIFYKKSEYSLIKSGTKWLSSTPDKVGSRISGSEYIRVMTYVVLYHKDTGTIYIYVNTHLDNADAGSVRVKQVNILMDIVDDLPNYPTILTGDLNGGLSSQVITRIQSGHGYTNLARKAAVTTSTYKTNTFWETKYPTVLDYIFLSDMDKFNALSYMVGNNSSRCSVYKYSDHYPLVSTFSLK